MSYVYLVGYDVNFDNNLVLMLEYIPGGILACVPHISEDLAYDVGGYLGKLHNTFQVNVVTHS